MYPRLRTNNIPADAFPAKQMCTYRLRWEKQEQKNSQPIFIRVRGLKLRIKRSRCMYTQQQQHLWVSYVRTFLCLFFFLPLVIQRKCQIKWAYPPNWLIIEELDYYLGLLWLITAGRLENWYASRRTWCSSKPSGCFLFLFACVDS